MSPRETPPQDPIELYVLISLGCTNLGYGTCSSIRVFTTSSFFIIVLPSTLREELMSGVSGRYYGGRALALALFFAACMDGPQGGVGSSSAALELPFPLPTDQILPTQEIGTLTGTLSAGLDGQASYTMALAVPPGRAGMLLMSNWSRCGQRLSRDTFCLTLISSTTVNG